MKPLAFERLESYRLASDFCVMVDRVIRSLGPKSAIAHNIERDLDQPMLSIARGSAALTRGDAVWDFRVARRAVRNVQRQLMWARDGEKGDQALVTAAIEVAERVRGLLTEDIRTLKAGRLPWSNCKW